MTYSAPLQSSPVHIGLNHGYAFEGDSVRLDAELLIDNAAEAATQGWALQLWACTTPFDRSAPCGTKVAELPLGSLEAGNPTWVSAFAAARPPAGQVEHTVVLALASGQDGQFNQVQDFATFPRAETFLQPRLIGNAAFSLLENSVTVSVDGIENPRAADNLSGSLALELWALALPYAGGEPLGVQLTSTDLGNLAGQNGWQNLSFDQNLVSRPAGSWNIALLLREWSHDGYATRDFVNFPLPVSWAAEEPAAVTAPAETVAEAAPAEAAPIEAAPVEEAKPATKKPAARKSAAKPDSAPAQVSINTASEAELAAVKGLSKTVAAAIVAARPFASLDELLKVKGMGVKLLDKLKASISL